MPTSKALFQRLLIIALSTALLSAAGFEFYNITWGTGVWLGEFSLKWGTAFCLYLLLAVAVLECIVLILWGNGRILSVVSNLADDRNRLGAFRWALVVALLLLPVWMLQYTAWGLVLRGQYLRLLLWAVLGMCIGWLLTSSREKAISFNGLFSGLILISGTIVFAISLADVTAYPFSLGWSEGNRFWDYSILFGRDIYIYPEDQPITVLLDVGRQFIGGIPFLFPGLTIWQERLWIGLGNAVPYFILGLVAFKTKNAIRSHWLLAAVWTMLFVIQGPIHPPLLWCAIFVAFAWGKPLWLAAPIIFATSYFAEISRYTWMFAPGMWAAMLEFSGASLEGGKLSRSTWTRTLSVGVAGILGGYAAPFFLPAWIAGVTAYLSGQAPDVSSLGGGVTLAGVGSEASSQALLWYRLFPNATYRYGILFGLLLAVGPLIAVLIYLSSTRRWTLTLLQKLAIILPLLAFFVVGLIVIVKTGAGGDLHNMDMFILGLLFAGAVAWNAGGKEWVTKTDGTPSWVRVALVLAVTIPAYIPFKVMRPAQVAEEDMTWVMTLADIPPQGPFPELLPYEQDADKALMGIQRAVAEAAPHGDILFIDQRQLLAFRYIEGIPLVPEYDKKVLINQAMSADEAYFKTFYHDLASQRFSLIVSNPLHERIQTEADNFGEENNAWVEWVSAPVLCFYEPLDTLKKVRVQLLVPKQDISACSQYLQP